jgi:hypothetical protein
MNYSSAWFEGDPRPCARRSTPRCAARCAWPASARRPRAGDRLRLGRAGRDGHHRIWRHADRRDAVHRAAGLCATAAHGRAVGTGSGKQPTCGCRTTATSRRPVRRHLLHRDGRSRGPRLLAHLLPDRRRLLKPGGRACIQSIVIDDACLSATSLHRLHPAVHLPRAAACPARANSGARRSSGPAGGGRIRLWSDYAETLRRWRDAFLASAPGPAAGF